MVAFRLCCLTFPFSFPSITKVEVNTSIFALSKIVHQLRVGSLELETEEMTGNVEASGWAFCREFL